MEGMWNVSRWKAFGGTRKASDGTRKAPGDIWNAFKGLVQKWVERINNVSRFIKAARKIINVFMIYK